MHSLSRIGLFDVDRPLSEVLADFEPGRVPTWADLMLTLVEPLDGMGVWALDSVPSWLSRSAVLCFSLKLLLVARCDRYSSNSS